MVIHYNISNYIIVSYDINSCPPCWAPRLSPHHPRSPRGQYVEPPKNTGGMMGDAQ